MKLYYLIAEDGSFLNRILPIKDDEIPDPGFLVSVNDFPIPTSVFPLQFTGEKWNELKVEAETPKSVNDLIEAIAAEDSFKGTTVQLIARQIVDQATQGSEILRRAAEREQKVEARLREAKDRIRKAGAAAPEVVSTPNLNARRKRPQTTPE